MKKLIAGNWKMNGTVASVRTLMEGIAGAMEDDLSVLDKCDFLLCPAYLHLPLVQQMKKILGVSVFLGGQDCAVTDDGAYTGDVSAAMLCDLGCEYVILGHSERRHYHDESDDIVCQKAALAHNKGLQTIICVGETESDRDAGKAEDVVAAQLSRSLPDTVNADNTVIAYEPVWAIGTGKTATPDDVAAMHKFIRKKLQEKLADFNRIRILYGGSMKPENAAELLATPNVDGGLIGGASLKAEQFVAIGQAA